MSSLNSVLDIAKNALLSSQKAISVTSHNIANANTPGYSRQVAVLEPMDPVSFGGLYFGTGVKTTSIARISDGFQTAQMRDATSNLSMFESRGEMLKALEGVVNDLGGTGISASLDAFFSSMNSVANNPSSYAERSVLISNATILAERFHEIDTYIRQSLGNLNSEVTAQINEANSIGAQIADLNVQISSVEISGVSANDLRDRRDELLKGLSSILDLSVVENNIGQVDVFVGGGPFLVAGPNSKQMTSEINSEDTDINNIVCNGVDLNGRLSGGTLKGKFEAAGILQGVRDELNLMAATLVKEVNYQHSLGYGLDGTTGNDFFAPLTVYTDPVVSNPGRAVISGGAVTASNLLTLDDYEVRFSSSSAYAVVNTTTDAVVTSGPYSSGSTIAFDGLSFVITDNTGTPAAGDRFRVSATKNAIRDISASVTNPNKIAASSTPAGLPGNNNNMLIMAGLKDSAVLDSSTFGQYYNAIVTDLGINVKETERNYEAQKLVTEEIQKARDSVSGVSVEEEAISLIKLQRAYEAAAKVMSTADKMLESLLNIR